MTSHPADKRLAAFAAGQLSDSEMDSVADHLESCARCTNRVDKLSPNIRPLAAKLGDELLRQVTPASKEAAGAETRVSEVTPGQALDATQAFDGSAVRRRQAPWSEEQLPVSFGRYQVLRKLGTGGMGVVYLADDTQLERHVALKIPFFEPRSDRDAVDRFYREAKSMATVLHPNLCPIYDVGEINGIPFLTMAYLKGHPLSEYLKTSRPQPDRQVATVVRKLALALHSAHVAGIVHRDLKPANVLIRTDQEPVVMDFGLAIDSARTRLTDEGSLIGTPHYMAPEQVAGDQNDIGPATDVYALGVILYQMLCGHLPFDGSLHEVLKQIAEHQPLPPSQVRSGVNASLEAICMKAIARPVADRYPSGRAMADDLGRFLKGESPRALKSPARQPTKELAVECPLCAAQLIVTNEQVGQPLRCDSCQSWTVVEEPVDRTASDPESRRPVTDATPMLRATTTPAGAQGRDVARDALRQAEAEVGQGRYQPPAPPNGRWLFADPRLVFRWLALAFGLQVEAALFDRMWLVSAPAGAVLFVVTAVTGLAVLRSAARDPDQVTDWPEFQWAGSIRDSTPVVASAMIALFAGWIIGQAIQFVGTSAMVVGGALSFATLFPVLLLSALEANAPVPLVSWPVLRSLQRAPRRWLRFFVQSSGLVAVAIFAWQIRQWQSTVGNFVVAVCVMGAILLLFYLMGRLLAEIAPWAIDKTEPAAGQNEQSE